MNFQVAEAFPVPRAGELCYSLEEQFVIHPLHIESVFDNWRQPGTRNGRRGEPESTIRFDREPGADRIFLCYDVPNSPRQLGYEPFPFRTLSLSVTLPERAGVRWRIFSGRPEETVYPDCGRELACLETELPAGTSVLTVEAGLPYFTCFSLELEGVPSVTAGTPVCLAEEPVVLRRLTERYRRWLDDIHFDRKLLAIHRIKVPELEQLAQEIEAVSLLPITAGNRRERHEFFRRWPYRLEPVWWRLGRAVRREFLLKRARLLKLELENEIAAADSEEELDRLEAILLPLWGKSGFHARREGKQLFSAEGEVMSLFGINDYDLATDQPCREDAYLYMRLLGYRLIRQPVCARCWDDRRKEYRPDYVEKYLRSAQLAARYGLNTILELHYVPPEVMERCRHTPPGGLFFDAFECEEWISEQLGIFLRELKENPSCVMVEVPSNEPFLHGNCRRSTTEKIALHLPDNHPWYRRQWNEFLHRRYRSFSALRAAWKHSTDRVAPDETWEDLRFPAHSMADSGRVADYIDFFVELYGACCGRLARLVKQVAPGKLVAMAQPSQSGIFALDPVRLDGVFLYQNPPPEIDLLTIHYNLGEARRLAASPLAGYFGEEYGQAVEQWEFARRRSCGMLPWGWSTRWRKGEDLIDLDGSGYLWPDKRHLAEEQERLLAAAPAPSVPVCILSSKRKIARGDHPWRETVQLLEAMQLECDLLDQDVVVAFPELAARYRLIIVDAEYGDPRLPEVLASQKAVVLYLGSPAREYHGRFGAAGFQAALTGLVRPVPMRPEEYLLDLAENEWERGLCRRDIVDRVEKERLMFSKASSIAADTGVTLEECRDIRTWERIHLPLGGSSDRRFWLRTVLRLPENWSPADGYELFASGVDDFDWCWINGTFVGGTQTTWNQRWSPFRRYALPPGVVSAGKNRLEWRIQRHTGLGGIYDLPVELRRRSAGPWRCGLEEFARFDAEPVVMAACVPDYSGSLAPGARIVARCGEKPLWICDAAWRNHLFLEGVCLQAENERHRRLIQFLLAQKP